MTDATPPPAPVTTPQTPAPTHHDDDDHGHGIGRRQTIGFFVGIAALLLTVVVGPPEGLSVEGWRTAGAGLLMAIFWISEPIPIPVTALLPLVLFPALGLGDIRTTAAPYANPIIYLFLGGFIIALSMQRWHLHRRIAIGLVGRLGTRPTAIVGGFLLASCFVSMWVSNTATTLMMLPIAMSVVHLLPTAPPQSRELADFRTALMLSIAYGATTGGMATLIGTPPNALLAAYMSEVYKVTIGFGEWMLLGVPVSVVSLAVVYLVLTRGLFTLGKAEVPGMRALIAQEQAQMGPVSRGEVAAGAVFVLTALGWVFQPLIAQAVPLVSDTTIAMTGALLLFMIPVDLRRGQFVMTWEDTKGLPWGVLLLFGGGLSLAGNIETHGLAAWLGQLAGQLEHVSVLGVLAIVTFGILLLTELTSNTATAATFLPITGALALSLGENPMLFLVPTALAANCSYMLPVGTPPNAIVYGSGVLPLSAMVRAGMVLNVLLVPIVVGLVLLIGPWLFGIEAGVVPPWARP